MTDGSIPPLPVRAEPGTLIFQDGRAYPDDTRYAGTRDAGMIEEYSWYNTGGSNALEAGRYTGSDAGQDRGILVKFGDLDTSWEAGACVEQATLTLNYYGSRNDPGGVPIFFRWGLPPSSRNEV